LWRSHPSLTKEGNSHNPSFFPNLDNSAFAKEGNTPFPNYHPENDIRQTIETRALTSRQRSSACVKRNLDSSAFAKEGYSRAQPFFLN